ncbi:MAG: hypothetical protein FWF35_00275 [Elusimicrobia bacterium]|nr:hypothetical protein [Elusimicrobiota bacterium]
MTENNTKNASLVHKAGKFRIQDNTQKGVENIHFSIFMETDIGREWWKKNNITKKVDAEEPDFLFETSMGKVIGLEITNFIVKTDKYEPAVALRGIANQVCQHFKKTKGIALSLTINFWDKRMWCACTFKELIAAAHDPGFKRLEMKNKDIKQAIIDVLQGDIKPRDLVKRSIEVGSQTFKITATRWNEPYISVSIGSEGMCIEDSFAELQKTIRDKDEKHKKYKEKCEKCDLLVVSDDSSTGNFADFTDQIKSYKFYSAFKNVYLLDLGFDTKVIKLKTKFIS